MMRQFELVELVKSYDPNADEAALNRAYVYSMKAHGSQLRASGDPYFSHPVEVAGLLAQMKLDTRLDRHRRCCTTRSRTRSPRSTISSGCSAPRSARLVDGVTKLSRIELQSDQTKQAENFRKLVLAMSEDIRVLLVKLADRLHNMRTLHFIKSDDKRRRIARETMDIYAPLAERIGMHRMKDELEDLAFAELHPDARASITARLGFLREQGGDLVSRIVAELTETLRRGRARRRRSPAARSRPIRSGARCSARTSRSSSSPTSWRFACWSTDVGDCYQALGIIHSAYQVVPGRFKDYISTPKPNNYRSLHTGVIGPERQRIEVQIRTREMHEVAELGVAAHWIYKQQMRPGRRAAISLAARAARHPRACLGPGGIPRAHQARDVPGPGLRLHAEGRPDRAAARRHAGRFRLCGAFRRSATPASAPRSTAAWCRCARSCRTATRSRSSPRRRRRRRRPGSALSSPARRAPASAALSARSSAPNISISAARSCRRRSASKATIFPNGRSKRS